MGTKKIETKMVEFIDERLIGNGLFHDALERKDFRQIMVLAAQACVGIREKGGNNRGPMVALIQDTIGGPDPLAWCMSFVETIIAYAEVKTGLKSPLYASESCASVWQKSPISLRVKNIPLPGAVIYYQHKGGSGHTGIVLACDGETLHAVEGNTEAGQIGDKIVRDGGGVYLTVRKTHGNADMNVTGYLKPI